MNKSFAIAAILGLLATGCSTRCPQKSNADLFLRLNEFEHQAKRYHQLRICASLAEVETTSQLVGSTNLPPSSPSAAALRRMEGSREMLDSIEHANATMKAELDRLATVIRKELGEKSLQEYEANQLPEDTARKLADPQH